MSNSVLQRFLSQYKLAQKEKDDLTDESILKIKINKITEKLAVFYERIRNAIDYKEEHLIRQFAIKRIIKRYPLNDLEKTEELAKKLLYELVQARYFSDNEVPEAYIIEIKQVFDKYIEVTANLEGPHKGKIKQWLLGMLACEIEEIIISPRKIKALMELMYRTLEPKINVLDFEVSENTKAQQLYIAINRTLMKTDKDLLNYRLMKSMYPDWKYNKDFDDSFFKSCLSEIYQEMQKALNHSLNNVLSKEIRKYAVVFNTLHEISEENLDKIEDVFNNTEKLVEEAQGSLKRKYKNIIKKVNKAVFKTIIYLFITKVTLALLLEIPYDTLMEGHINYLTVGINVFMPPLLMFFLAMTISIPKKKNTKAVINKLKTILYKPQEINIILVKKAKPKKTILMKIFQVFYKVIFLFTFSAIIYLLWRLDFNIVGGVLFMLFLSLVSYLGMQIRRSATSIIIVKQRKGFIASLFDVFAYPILKVGKWFTNKFDQYNLFVLFFDVILEAPIKSLMFIVDAWFDFMQQKEEDL